MADRSSVASRNIGSCETLLGAGGSLENVNTTLLDDGCFCYVASEHEHYELHRDSAASPNPPLVIAPAAGGPGRWVPATGGTIGAQGFQGAQGRQGATGTQGFQGGGAQGAQGSTGAQGSGGGAQGAQGATGQQGFQGAVGQQGAQGATGQQGAQGGTGQQGAQGAGFQGAQGATGAAGSQGAQGFQGAGLNGSQGFQGAQGSQGFQGSSGIVGVSLGTTSPLAGGGLLSSGLTLSVNTVSGSSAGVVPQISTANGVLMANGSGTSSAWALITNANISASAVIAITKLEVGPANTYLKGTGSGNVWAATQTAPASPGDNGKVFIASAGDASFLGGTAQGQALTWDTTNGWVAGTNFGAQNLLTTGYLQFGAAPALSGASIRGPQGFQIVARNAAGSLDVNLMSYGTAGTGANALFIGGDTIGTGPSVTLTSGSNVVLAPSGGSYTFGNTVILFPQTFTAFDFVSNVLFTILNNTNIGPTIASSMSSNAQDISGSGATTGGAYSSRAGDATGAGPNTGGSWSARPGAGTVGGLGSLKKGNGTTIFSWNDTGLGLYAATTVAQAARVGQLTDSTTGTPSTTLVDVGVAFSQANVNNNFASVLTKINAIETAIHNIGLTA